ncbi:MAG TPA: VOC family protein [Bauldia sp.]|nr:VOC family protein [Bauldia sp.]
MASRLNPYLSFKDNARQAMEFYKSVFGGELTMMTFGEGGMSQEPGQKDLIMHSQLVAPNGYWLMGSDTPPSMPMQAGRSITVSLSGDDEKELRGYWDKLAAGAQIQMPLEKAPWGDTFGMLTDRFGTPWMVNIAGKRS